MRVTKVVVPGRPDLKQQHDFKLGEQVRHKQHPGMVGTVAHLPSGPVAQLGPHVVGNEMGVDMPDGTRSVANVDMWERV